MYPLFHVSEEAGIQIFHPRLSTAAPSLGEVVWAVAESHLPNYLLPRDCPRVTFCASSITSRDDRERFQVPDAGRVIVIETAWVPRVASTTLYVYQLPPSDFTLYDESAGYWVSRQSVVPVGMKTIADPAGAIKEHGAEVRIMDHLWQLRDDIVRSSLDYSIIRMRNASAMPSELEIRGEEPDDCEAIRDVVSAAFPSDLEARLVDLLRQRERAAISLVAVASNRVVGHALFSPVAIAHAPPGFHCLGLAPVAVRPECQNNGIGSALIREGLRRCTEEGYDAVVVLGHPRYYARFGFRRASDYGLDNEYSAADAFMVLALKDGILDRVSGLVRYGSEFREAGC